MLAGAIRKSCELWRKPGSHVATAHGLQQNHCARSVKTLKPGKTQILGHCFASKQLHFQQLLTNTQTSFLETGCQRDSGRCSVTVQIKGELKNWDLSSRFQKLPNCRYFLSWAGLLSRSKSKKSKHYDLASIRSIHFASDPSCLFYCMFEYFDHGRNYVGEEVSRSDVHLKTQKKCTLREETSHRARTPHILQDAEI